MPEFIYKILMFGFLFPNSILHIEMFRIIVWGKFSPGLSCLENISVGREIFP